MFDFGILVACSNAVVDHTNPGTDEAGYPVCLWFHRPLVAILKLVFNSGISPHIGCGSQSRVGKPAPSAHGRTP